MLEKKYKAYFLCLLLYIPAIIWVQIKWNKMIPVNHGDIKKHYYFRISKHPRIKIKALLEKKDIYKAYKILFILELYYTKS